MRIGALFCCLLATAPTVAWGASREASRKVREGLGRYAAGDYVGAGQAFDAALEAEPNDARILFDRGCAALAAGDFESAIQFFERASLTPDANLAARAHYNAAGAWVQKAKGRLGADPASAAPSARQEALEWTDKAAGRYRDAIALDPSYEPARRNLELLRLWIADVKRAWERGNREKAAAELGPLELLRRLRVEQKAVRARTRTARISGGRTPGDVADRQRRLADSVPALRRKLEVEYEKNSPNSAAGPARPLLSVVDQVEKLMRQAARELEKDSVAAAATQTKTLDHIRRIERDLLAFDSLIDRAIGLQESLLGQTTSSNEASGRSDEDWGDLGEEQAEVGRQAESLGAKAQARNQWGDPRSAPALQKAVKLSPLIAEKAHLASNALRAKNESKAKPPQEEALAMLRELKSQVQPPSDKQEHTPRGGEGSEDKNKSSTGNSEKKQSNDRTGRNSTKQYEPAEKGEGARKAADEPADGERSPGKNPARREQTEGQKPPPDRATVDAKASGQEPSTAEQRPAAEKENESSKGREEPSSSRLESMGNRLRESVEGPSQGAQSPLSERELRGSAKSSTGQSNFSEKSAAQLRRVRQRQVDHQTRIRKIEAALEGDRVDEKDW